EAGALGEQPQLAWREARRREVERRLVPRLVAHAGALVVDAGPGVERLAFLEETHGEVGRERGQCQPAARTQGEGDAGDHVGVLTGHEPERPLTERYGGVELRVVRQPPGVEALERRVRRRARAR